MEKLIPFIYDLHDILNQAGLSIELNLPSIVVLGSQSFCQEESHKKINRDLITLSFECSQLWIRKQKIFESEERRRLIETETEKVAGKNKGMSPVSITVKYFFNDILELQLIDLRTQIQWIEELMIQMIC